jgi:hypothetical protein
MDELEIANRIAEQEAAITGRGKIPAEERARRHALYELIRRACRDASVCAKCGRKVAPLEPVYITKVQWTPYLLSGPVCYECAPEYVREWLDGAGGFTCEGCGRRMEVGYGLPGQERRHSLCSEVCRYRYYNRRRSERATAARSGRSCEQCGAEFDAVRSDQRSCSGACRQRAYRLRRSR